MSPQISVVSNGVGRADGRSASRSRVSVSCSRCVAAPARGGQVASPPPAPAGQTAAPALSREQIREFLPTAKIIKGKDTAKGVTRPVRVTLSDGTLTHDAVFSTVDEHKDIERFESGKVELDFVDSYKFTPRGVQGRGARGSRRHDAGARGARVARTQGRARLVGRRRMMEEGERLKKKVRCPTRGMERADVPHARLHAAGGRHGSQRREPPHRRRTGSCG